MSDRDHVPAAGSTEVANPGKRFLTESYRRCIVTGHAGLGETLRNRQDINDLSYSQSRQCSNESGYAQRTAACEMTSTKYCRPDVARPDHAHRPSHSASDSVSAVRSRCFFLMRWMRKHPARRLYRN